MAHKKKKKRPKNKFSENDYSDVLKEKVSVTVDELIRMIHRINPTGEDISSKKASERYKIKTQLQNLLIRRFHENLIVEQPDPENPRVVGFRLGHFDIDACHTLIDELDEDARSWTQRQIDEALTENPFAVTEISRKYNPSNSASIADDSTNNKLKKREEDLSKDELIQLGQKALDEYDYDACEKYFLRALKVAGDDPAPVLFLLELYVDYLAAYEKAVDLFSTIPTSVKSNDKVNLLSALDAARNGRTEPALEFIKGVSHPRVAEVYVLLVEHLIQEGDLDCASNLLGKLASFEQAELKLTIEQLAESIQSLRAKSLQPTVQEMILADRQGRTGESLKLAGKILAVSPENKEARRLLHEYKKQQRQEKINQLLRLADEAKKNKDYSREVELLDKAISAGAKAENLAKRLEYARNEAKRKKEKLEIQRFMNLLAEGDKKNAFLHYIHLTTHQQNLIKNTTHDPLLAWLDQILSAKTTTKPEKLVEAVLVLSKSKEALNEKKEPERILEELEPYAKVLQSVPEAQILWQQAQNLLHTVKCQEAKDFLQKAVDFLERNDPQQARACMDQIKVNLLQEKDKKLFDNINLRLQYLEKFIRLKQNHLDAQNRGDHFAAKKIAGELAEHTGPAFGKMIGSSAVHTGFSPEQIAGEPAEHHGFAAKKIGGESKEHTEQAPPEYWLERIKEHTSHIKKEWALVAIDIDELPMYYASFGFYWMSEDIFSCLLPDERQLILATSQERWVFLRIFCLDDQKFKKAILLRTPKQIDVHNIYAVGKVLWITGRNGDVVELGLEPLTILSWYDFGSFVREEEVVEGAWVFPKSKSLWLNKRDKKIPSDETIDIVDINQQRVARRLKCAFYPMVINAGGHFRIGMQNITTKTVQFYSERGKHGESFTFEHFQAINATALHPNGKDFVFLPFDNSGAMDPFQEYDEEQGDLHIYMEVRPDLEAKYPPLLIENTNGELHHRIFTSLDTGIIFIYYQDASSEDSKYLLAAYKETEQGLALLYKVTIPEKIAFASDEFCRHLAAINFQGDKVKAIILNEKPPVFDFKIHDDPLKNAFPLFKSLHFYCNNPKGEIKATSLAYMLQLKNPTEKDLNDTIKKFKQPGSNNPDDFAAFIYALKRTFLFEKANDMKMCMRTQYPNHFSCLLDMAEEAANGNKWPEVISLLEKISRIGLNDGSSCHICHLLGIAYFIQGEIKKARDIWKEGLTYENGECDLIPYIKYAELSLMPKNKRKKQKSAMAKILNIFETVDDHLDNKRWCEVIEIIEKNVALSKKDLQLLSRLTWAYLNKNFGPNEIQRIFKIITLGNYCQIYNDTFIQHNIVLPPCIEKWSEGRLSDLAKQAKQWLDDL